jgi:hypothetical protein
MFGTNSTKAPPKIAPGNQPTPPTTRPTRKAIDRTRVKLSGATNCTMIAPSAPAMPV